MPGLVEAYRQRGFVGPLAGVTPHEAGRVWERLRPCMTEGRWGGRNRHLDRSELARLCRHPRVVEAVTAVLGEDVLLWRSNLFALGRTSRMGLRWHQDRYTTLLDGASGDAHCSIQLAFTPSTERNCVRVVPGSHRWTDDELRQRGWVPVPGREHSPNGTPDWGHPPGLRSVPILLAPGEFYLFHPGLLHGSMQGTRLTAAEAPHADRRRFRLRWWIRCLPGLLRPPPDRCSVAMRFCQPGVRVRDRAFSESAPRVGPALVAGRNHPARNELARWPHR